MKGQPSGQPALLTAEELEVWRAWKRAHDVVRAHVLEEVTAVTGLSDAEFAILARIDEDAGRVRQNRLAELMGWHRSRLSHQLTRMEGRGWLTRQTVPGGVEVLMCQAGQEVVDVARPLHAAGVRRHFSQMLDGDELGLLHEVLRRLNQGTADTESTRPVE